MSQLVRRLRKDSYAAKQLKKHEKILKTKDPNGVRLRGME